jgi:hypothetical protein
VVFVSPDGTVAAVDDRERAIKWFDRESGDLRRFLRFETGWIGTTPPVHLNREQEILVFPLTDFESRTSLGVLYLDEGRWERAGSLPDPYHQSLDEGSGGFAAFFYAGLVAPFDSSEVVVGLSGSETLFRFDVSEGTGSPLGRVPHRFRRGARDDLWRNFDIPSEYGTGMPFSWASTMMSMGRLSDGRIAVVHVDQEYEGTPPALHLTGTHYLTVLDPSTDVACIDIPVPGGNESRTVVAIQNDHLYLLDRRIVGMDSEAWMLRLPVPSMDDCPSAHRGGGWLANSPR